MLGKIKKVDQLILYIFSIISAIKLTIFNFWLTSDTETKLIFGKFLLYLGTLGFCYFLLSKIKFRIAFFLFYFIQTIYFYTYISYYSFFRSYLNIFHSISLYKEAFELVKASSVPFEPFVLILLIDLPVFIYIIVRYKPIREILKNPVKRVTIGTISSLFFLLLFICTQSVFFLDKPFETPFSEKKLRNLVKEETIITCYGTLFNAALQYVNANKETDFINSLVYGQEIYRKKAENKLFNIVFIQVEGLQANAFDLKHKEKYVMPYMHEISRKYIYYPFNFSYHKGGCSSDAEMAVFNNIEPFDTFPMILLRTYDYHNSAIRDFKANGYQTFAFHNNKGDYFNRFMAYRKMGFEEFFDIKKMGYEKEDRFWGAQDGIMFDYVTEKLKIQEPPYFYYIITMSSHPPFNFVGDKYYVNKEFDDIDHKRTRDYFNSLSYVDKVLSKFITYCLDNLKDTYIVLYGDHIAGLSSKYCPKPSVTIDNKYMEFVPLLIITPDRQKYMETEVVSSFLDIMPTILYKSGISFLYKALGENLLADKKPTKKIPFKGNIYDRKSLHTEVSSKFAF